MFLREVSYAHQGCIYLMKNTVKRVILWNIILISNNCCLFKYILTFNFSQWFKAEFWTSLLQSSVSHDSSEIIRCWFAAHILVEIITHFFRIIKKSFKNDFHYYNNECILEHLNSIGYYKCISLFIMLFIVMFPIMQASLLLFGWIVPQIMQL